MNPDTDDVWWKRAFTVVGIAVGAIVAIAYLCVSESPILGAKIAGALLIFGAGFVIVYLIKMGACYIVEGPTKRIPKDKDSDQPSN